MRAETDEIDPVILIITIKNETGKYYFSLDSKDYSNYPEENEILLQAGLIFEYHGHSVINLTQETTITEIYLSTSEKLVK